MSIRGLSGVMLINNQSKYIQAFYSNDDIIISVQAFSFRKAHIESRYDDKAVGIIKQADRWYHDKEFKNLFFGWIDGDDPVGSGLFRAITFEIGNKLAEHHSGYAKFSGDQQRI
jgi:hypothetical protein